MYMNETMFLKRLVPAPRSTRPSSVSSRPHGHKTSSSAVAEGPRDALVSRNSATTKYRYRVALFA